MNKHMAHAISTGTDFFIPKSPSPRLYTTVIYYFTNKQWC